MNNPVHKEKVEAITSDYNEWLIQRLKNDKKEAAMYLDLALEDYQKNSNLDEFLIALRQVAAAQGGLGKLATKTQLNRESLYKTLSKNGNPKLQTISRLLKALGFELCVRVAEPDL